MGGERGKQTGQRKDVLNWLLAPLRRRKQRTSIIEMTKKTFSLGWVAFLFSQEVSGVVRGAG